jgi:DNA-binding GntR family transcriptional regulator
MMTELKSLAEATAPSYRAAPEYIADVLRDAIVAGILKQGMALRQDELAAAFGVSRIPVREALRHLEAEGLVDLRAHKGAAVATLSPEEALEISEMRSVLEPLALRISLPHLAEHDIRDASKLLDEMDATQDLGLLCKLHTRFHMGLYGGAKRPRLLALIESLHLRAERYLRFQVGQLSYGKQGQAEHRQIVAVCAEKDVELACELLDEHIKKSGERLVESLRASS